MTCVCGQRQPSSNVMISNSAYLNPDRAALPVSHPASWPPPSTSRADCAHGSSPTRVLPGQARWARKMPPKITVRRSLGTRRRQTQSRSLVDEACFLNAPRGCPASIVVAAAAARGARRLCGRCSTLCKFGKLQVGKLLVLAIIPAWLI